MMMGGRERRLMGETLEYVRDEFQRGYSLGETTSKLSRRLGAKYGVSWTTVRDAVTGVGGYRGIRDLRNG